MCSARVIKFCVLVEKSNFDPLQYILGGEEEKREEEEEEKR
jgi:hypothetical protein